MKNLLRIMQALMILNMVFVFCILFLANVSVASAGVKDDRMNVAKTKSEELHLNFIEKTAELLNNNQDALNSKTNITVTDSIYCVISRSQSYVTTLQGAGTQEYPYLIYTAQELDSIRNILNQPVHYRLMCDIDLSAYGPSVGGWTPIGYYNSNNDINGFNGFFDGNNHVINGLYINSDLTCLGLFGYTTSSSEINNIILEDMDVSSAGSSNSYVGGLVGWASGSISNSHVTGIVSSSSANFLLIGGLVGYADGSISNCTSNVRVSSALDSVIGGLVGAADGSISNCNATGSVSSLGGSDIGGLVGYTRGNISGSHSTGSVSSSFNSNIGGLVGSISSSISNSYATGSVSSTGSVSTTYDFCNIGGLVGAAYGSISNCYAAGSVLSECDSDIGGLVGSISLKI